MTYVPGADVLVTGSEDNSAKVWNVKTGELVRSLEGHRPPEAPKGITIRSSRHPWTRSSSLLTLTMSVIIIHVPTLLLL